LTRSIATAATLCSACLPSNASVARHPPAPKSCNGLRYDGAIEADSSRSGRWGDDIACPVIIPDRGELTDLLFA